MALSSREARSFEDQAGFSSEVRDGTAVTDEKGRKGRKGKEGGGETTTEDEGSERNGNESSHSRSLYIGFISLADVIVALCSTLLNLLPS